MKKFLFAAALLLISSGLLFTDSFRLSTYYPSPFGLYKELSASSLQSGLKTFLATNAAGFVTVGKPKGSARSGSAVLEINGNAQFQDAQAADFRENGTVRIGGKTIGLHPFKAGSNVVLTPSDGRWWENPVRVDLAAASGGPNPLYKSSYFCDYRTNSGPGGALYSFDTCSPICTTTICTTLCGVVFGKGYYCQGIYDCSGNCVTGSSAKVWTCSNTKTASGGCP